MAQDRIRYRAVIIGGSAGSLEVLLQLVPFLPADAGIAYIFVLHRKNEPDSLLADLLSSRTSMPVREAEDKDELCSNCIIIAPPDYHLLFENDGTLSLDSSEKIHYSRPSIDVSFESAAGVFGDKLIGILLSGANADGAAGLKKIADSGGYTVVQDPSTAEVNYMPLQAIKLEESHAVLIPDDIKKQLIALLWSV